MIQYFQFGNKIVTFFLVDCKLGAYKLGQCSATCGISAVRSKRRQVIQKAAYGGKPCDDNTKVIENCGLLPCPGDSKSKLQPKL